MSRAEKHFDALDFVKKSKALGVKDELAEYQARQLENVIDIAAFTARQEFNVHELATKTDLKQLEVEIVKFGVEIKQIESKLEIKIEQYRYDTLKFVIWTGVGVVIFLGGLLAKGFHWFG